MRIDVKRYDRVLTTTHQRPLHTPLLVIGSVVLSLHFTIQEKPREAGKLQTGPQRWSAFY